MPERERSLKVEALVLRHQDWGEADRLLSLFTREKGKLRVVAKGVRRIHSRKSGHVEPFTHVALLLHYGKSFWLAVQAEAVEPFLNLREDLLRTASAMYCIELVDQFTYEDSPNPELFELLCQTIRRLDAQNDPFIVVRYFEIHLLGALGFQPQLQECVQCHKVLEPPDQFVSPEMGGALCPSCGMFAPAARQVSLSAFKYLRHYQRSEFPAAARYAVQKNVRD